MNGNLLLLYLSELGNGRWTQFADALKTLSATWGRSTHARHLQMLAHVEFDFLSDPIRWSVSPPTLAWLPRRDNNHRAVLCGQRTEPLLAKLQQSATDLGCQIEINPQENNPDAVFIIAKDSYQLDAIADQTEIASEPKSAARIAQCLPHLDDYLALCPLKDEPHGYGIKEFDLTEKKWHEVERTSATGLFEYDCVEGRQYRLKIDGKCRQLPRNTGIYALMHHYHLPVLQYDVDSHEMIVPRYANFPALFARAAVLCSGKLPYYDYVNKQYRYQDVTTAVAYSIFTKLKHEAQFR